MGLAWRQDAPLALGAKSRVSGAASLARVNRKGPPHNSPFTIHHLHLAGAGHLAPDSQLLPFKGSYVLGQKSTHDEEAAGGAGTKPPACAWPGDARRPAAHPRHPSTAGALLQVGRSRPANAGRRPRCLQGLLEGHRDEGISAVALRGVWCGTARGNLKPSPSQPTMFKKTKGVR